MFEPADTVFSLIYIYIYIVKSNDVLTFASIIYTKSVIGVCIVVLFLPLPLLLFSNVFVPNRLMMILCAHPPVSTP